MRRRALGGAEGSFVSMSQFMAERPKRALDVYSLGKKVCVYATP